MYNKMANTSIEDFLKEELPIDARRIDKFYDYFERLLAVENPLRETTIRGDLLEIEVERIKTKGGIYESKEIIKEAETTYKRVVHKVMINVRDQIQRLSLTQLDHLLDGPPSLTGGVIAAAKKRRD